MPSVALIGPDGAGKTTLTRMLLSSGALPFRYIYMGVDIGASNVALPTSRMADRWKRRRRMQTDGDMRVSLQRPGRRSRPEDGSERSHD
jgi:ABC-type phosphate/phosphonate transport system ATPase subunit